MSDLDQEGAASGPKPRAAEGGAEQDGAANGPKPRAEGELDGAAGGEKPRASEHDGPPSSAADRGIVEPLLKSMRAIAVFAVVAVIVGRALAPSMRGAGVGLGFIAEPFARLGAIVSQVFAFAAMLATLFAVIVTARSRLPLATRFGAITLGGFAILPTVWAAHQPVPDLSAALVAGSAATLALLAAPVALRAPFSRGPALVVVLVAAGGFLRLGAVMLAIAASAAGGARFGPWARAVATGSFLVDALAIAAAIGWISARSKRLTSPASVAILVIALFCTRQAMIGRADGIHPLDIVLWQAAQRLAVRPEPALPVGFQIFIAFLGPLVALWAALARGAIAPLGAAVALALAAHGALEMPPSALMLMIAALGLSHTAHEGRGLWSMIGGEPRRS